MKRVLTFVIALAFVVGASAPAVFASDLPAIPSNSEPVSIWDTSSTSVENPYNTLDLFNWCINAWGDLFDDGRLNNYTVTDFQRDDVAWYVSKYVATHEDEEINGVVTSYFDDIVDYVCAHPLDFDIYWNFAVNTWWLDGNIYGQLLAGDNFFENLKDYIYANYYTTPSSSQFDINGHIWVGVPFTLILSGSTYLAYYTYHNGGSTFVAYYTRVGNNLCMASWEPYQATISRINLGGSNWTGIGQSQYSFNGTSYQVGGLNNAYPSVITSSQYSSNFEAYADFYNNFELSPSEPVSNGKVYLREEPLGGDNVNFSFPAAPVSNSKAVSNYYYNTYGDDWEDSSTVINETVYNNNTTTLYPVTYENNIPLWLIQSNSTIETFDYSLELPSAPLEALPSDFEGGGSFFQNSFLVLGGFGAFVLVGLSFSLVGLFFKE